MIKIDLNTVNTVLLTLWEDSSNKCEDNFYLFEIKNKNNNQFKSIVLEDISLYEQRIRFNEFKFDLINDEDLKTIFDLVGTYTFNVFEYDVLNELKLNFIESGMFYVPENKSFNQKNKNVEYVIYGKE